MRTDGDTTYAHQWKLAGGDTGDLMLVLGWTSDDMPRHYGASVAAERALLTQARLGIGERIWRTRISFGTKRSWVQNPATPTQVSGRF